MSDARQMRRRYLKRFGYVAINLPIRPLRGSHTF
jgi:hypothetical protein